MKLPPVAMAPSPPVMKPVSPPAAEPAAPWTRRWAMGELPTRDRALLAAGPMRPPKAAPIPPPSAPRAPLRPTCFQSMG